MQLPKVLFYGTILVARMFTALAVPSMANPSRDAKGRSSQQSDVLVANGATGSEIQVKGEIDEQLEKRQVRTCLSFAGGEG